MADREWFMTKMAGSILAVLLLMSIGIGAANLHYDLARDVQRNEANQKQHSDDDAKKWDVVLADVGENEDNITLLRLENKERETQFLDIVRRLEELRAELSKWEPPRG
jgi:hypothetical protein